VRNANYSRRRLAIETFAKSFGLDNDLVKNLFRYGSLLDKATHGTFK